MKRRLVKFLLFSLIILSSFFTTFAFADPPGPPPPGGDPAGNGGHPVGGNTIGGPIGDGGGVLLCLGVVYGCYRLFEIWKKKTDSKEEKIV
jgi:hypothetical protein